MANEKRLIDANLLLQWVEKAEAYNMGRIGCGKKPKGLTPEGVRHMVDTMPTVDAVEVVRCKDCMWFDTDDELADVFHKERHCFCTDVNTYVSENGFCSCGERKEE